MNDSSGGAFQVARQIFDSEFWTTKPASWKIIWIYMIGKVRHNTDNGFERGEGYFNFTKEAKQIGIDITTDMIKKFCQYARNNGMIDTSRSTRGIRIKVLNYNEYQTLNNYTSTNVSTREAREKHERSTPINKNVKNVKNKSYSHNSDEFRLAELLLSLIKTRNPSYKNPNIQEWAKHIDYMIRIDRRQAVEIEKIIKACQRDPFWQNNILSTEKLRKQYDQLTLKLAVKQGTIWPTEVVL